MLKNNVFISINDVIIQIFCFVSGKQYNIYPHHYIMDGIRKEINGFLSFIPYGWMIKCEQSTVVNVSN